ncbi:MAG: leucine-rich repeat domain-containing protein [Lachnospiraceae bacterium]|nr:leucine-rich repeat domain-containing protein [Lachnospiraceae bacterium]
MQGEKDLLRIEDSANVYVDQDLTEPKPNPEPAPGPKDPEKKEPAAVGTELNKEGLPGVYVVVASESGEPEVAFKAPLSKDESQIVIPDTIIADGVTYKVTQIADKAFAKNKKLTKVTMGKNVLKIGKKAFSGCVKLSSETITIGDLAFENCKALKSLTLPENGQDQSAQGNGKEIQGIVRQKRSAFFSKSKISI